MSTTTPVVGGAPRTQCWYRLRGVRTSTKSSAVCRPGRRVGTDPNRGSPFRSPKAQVAAVGESLRLGIQSPPEAQPRAAVRVQDGGLHKRVGEDSDFLWSRSPLSKVDDIRIPVLVAPRRERSRMRRAESEQIVAAMNERGIDHEYAMYENEATATTGSIGSSPSTSGAGLSDLTVHAAAVRLRAFATATGR